MKKCLMVFCSMVIAFSALFRPVPSGSAAGPVFNVVDYGAVGDGKTLDTQAINKALEACSRNRQGTVLFPRGTYLSGSIHLKSHVTVQIDSGATVLGAPNDINAYDPPEPNPWDQYQDFGHSHFRNALMWGEELENVTVQGKGIIHGGGITRGDPKPGGGDKAVSLKLCRNVVIRDITILQGGHFAILMTGCDKVTIDRIKVRTSRDGINIVGCRNVDVNHCEVRAIRYEGPRAETIEGTVPRGGDDAIGIKSDYSLGRKMLSEHITVRNCKLSTGCNALQFGSETVGDFRNIRFSDCEIEHADKAGIGITTNDGAVIDGVAYKNITMTKAATPFFINVGARLRSPEKPSIGSIRNIRFDNITSTDTYGYMKNCTFTATLSGRPERPVENVVFNNVKIIYKGGGTREQAENVPPFPEGYAPADLGVRPAYGFFIRHARGLEFRNVEIGFEKEDLRPAVVAEDVDGLRFDRLNAHRAAGVDCDVVLKNVRKYSIQNSGKIKTRP